MINAPTALLVLDIDGTVRKGKEELGHIVHKPEEVEVFPEAVKLMQDWKARGGRIISASNQGGIALGLLTLEDVMANMQETQRQCLGLFDKMAFCVHNPQAKTPLLARCWCRKPAPGMVIEAALDLGSITGECYPPHMALFVGDRPEDKECAKLLSMDFMDAKDWRKMA